MGKVLAIKGHPTRGNEVIELLEMLGGHNKYHINDTECNLLYTIREGDDVIIGTYPNGGISQVYTLEQFLEKYPFKVGDKVKYKPVTSCGAIFVIEKMKWEDNQIKYIIRNTWCNARNRTVTAEYLQPYKEETMEERNEKSVNHVFNTEVISFDIAQKDKYELDLQGKFKVVLRKGKYYVERIKPKYPKTYEESCEVISINRHDVEIDIPQPYQQNMFHFFKLLICRDAYWKIAGEQMGLSESWKPDWSNNQQQKYTIHFYQNQLTLTQGPNVSYILAFPNKEMRDFFAENFNELIMKCIDFL